MKSPRGKTNEASKTPAARRWDGGRTKGLQAKSLVAGFDIEVKCLADEKRAWRSLLMTWMLHALGAQYRIILGSETPEGVLFRGRG